METNERWAYFIGSDRGRLKLTTKPEPYTLTRTLNWIIRQVAPTWKVLQQIDYTNGTTYLKDILNHAKLTERHKSWLNSRQLPQKNHNTGGMTTWKAFIWPVPVLTWSRLWRSYHVLYADSKSRRQRNWNDGKEKEIMNFGQNLYNWFYLTHSPLCLWQSLLSECISDLSESFPNLSGSWWLL